MMFLNKSMALLALYASVGSVVGANDAESRHPFRLLWEGPTISGEDNAFRSRVISKDATNRVVTTRIVGGTNAPAGRYPYYTYIEVNTVTNVFACSASLIWEDIILTSAHCILDLVEAGENITSTSAWIGLENQTDAGFAASEARQVVLAVPHPDYVSQTQQNDIMIMKLDQPVLTIEPVMYNTLTPNVPVDGQRVDVFGFGLTSSDATTFPNDLQTVDVQVIPFDDCNDANSYDGAVFDDVMICAGVEGGGRDACAGDSGSPLIVPGADAEGDLLVGLVSFGDGCALPDKPGVYSRVSSFTRFIFNQLCNFGENPPDECDTTPFNTPAMSPNMVPEPTTAAPIPAASPVPVSSPATTAPVPLTLPTMAPVPSKAMPVKAGGKGSKGGSSKGGKMGMGSSPSAVSPVHKPSKVPVPASTKVPSVSVPGVVMGSQTGSMGMGSMESTRSMGSVGPKGVTGMGSMAPSIVPLPTTSLSPSTTSMGTGPVEVSSSTMGMGQSDGTMGMGTMGSTRSNGSSRSMGMQSMAPSVVPLPTTSFSPSRTSMGMGAIGAGDAPVITSPGMGMGITGMGTNSGSPASQPTMGMGTMGMGSGTASPTSPPLLITAIPTSSSTGNLDVFDIATDSSMDFGLSPSTGPGTPASPDLMNLLAGMKIGMTRPLSLPVRAPNSLIMGSSSTSALDAIKSLSMMSMGNAGRMGM